MDPTNNELSATSDTTRTMDSIMRALPRMSPASHHRREVQIVDDRLSAQTSLPRGCSPTVHLHDTGVHMAAHYLCSVGAAVTSLS